jgi:hypothetical protein
MAGKFSKIMFEIGSMIGARFYLLTTQACDLAGEQAPFSILRARIQRSNPSFANAVKQTIDHHTATMSCGGLHRKTYARCQEMAFFDLRIDCRKAWWRRAVGTTATHGICDGAVISHR